MPLFRQKDAHTEHRHGDDIHDIRLVLPALALWATALAGAHWGIRVLGGVVASATVGTLSIWWVRQRHTESPLLSLMLSVFLAVVLGGAAVLPHLWLAQQGMHTLYPGRSVSPSGSPTSSSHQSPSISSGAPRSRAASSRVVVGRIASRPRHNDAETRFALRTAYGEMEIHARTPQFQKLVLGQRITLVVKPFRPPEHHLSLGEWRAVYLRNARAPQGIWAFSALVAGHWEDALSVADTAGLTTSLHALARGMTIGDTSGLTPRQQHCYRASGLTHLTAVSGANVSYVLLLAGVVLHHASPRRRVAVHTLLLILFAALIGPEPAVLRATISGAVGVLALWEGGRSAAFPALGAGILSLLIVSPPFAVSPGFLLSVAATAALIWAAPRVSERLALSGLPKAVAEVLAVTVVAALSTLPLGLYLFGTASVLGVLANILVAPVVPIITAVGLVGVVVSLLFPLAGAVLVMVLWPALWWVEKVGMSLGGPRWAQIVLPETLSPGLLPTLVPSVLTTAILAAAVLACRTRVGRGVVASLVILAGVVTGGHAVWSYRYLMACQTQPDSLTLVSPALHSASQRTQQSSSTTSIQQAVWVRQEGVHHRPQRPVVVLEGALTAATLPHIDELAKTLPNPVIVHQKTTAAHASTMRHSGASVQHDGPLSSTVSFTPRGTPVLELAPGETVTVTATNQICRIGMAR